MHRRNVAKVSRSAVNSGRSRVTLKFPSQRWLGERLSRPTARTIKTSGVLSRRSIGMGSEAAKVGIGLNQNAVGRADGMESRVVQSTKKQTNDRSGVLSR